MAKAKRHGAWEPTTFNPSNQQAATGPLTPAEVRGAIQALCKELNYDPIRRLIELAQADQEVVVGDVKVKVPLADVDQQIAIAKEIAQYIAPKVKSVEVQGKVDTTLTVVIKKVGGSNKVIDLPVNTGQVGHGAATNMDDAQRVLQDRILEPQNKLKDILGEQLKEEALNGD